VHRHIPPIWKIRKRLWRVAAGILPKEKPRGSVGRPAVSFRTVLDGILYVLRTGCQWKALPKEYSSGSTVHRRFQEWAQSGVFTKLWAALLRLYDRVKGIAWEWQSIDGSMVKSPLGGEKTGKNPTDRGKLGTKRSILVDRRGVPLSLALGGANTHDMKLLIPTLDGLVVVRPGRKKQNGCLDKGYDFPEVERELRRRGYIPHIRRKGERKKKGRHTPKRWVVERTASWYNRFRKLLVRFEKKEENHLGLLQLASSLIVYRAIRW